MATICLVACARSKAASRAAAKDLYVSSLFRKASAFASEHFDRWYILSAKYGLLEPERVVEPYDKTLNNMTRQERKLWAREVLSDLLSRIAPGDEITFLAGQRYREHLMLWLSARGHSVHVPLAGMRIGEQLRWLTERP